MKFNKLSLKARFTIISSIIPLVISFLFAGLIYRTVHDMESILIGRLLDSLTDWYIDLDNRVGHLEKNYPKGIKLYKLTNVDDPLNPAPYYVYNLDNGFHEIVSGDIDLHLIVKVIDGEHYVMTFDQRDFEELEIKIYTAVGIALLIFTILGMWSGLVLSNLAIKPVTNLALQVRESDPSNINQKLSSYYADDVVGELASSFDNQLEQINYFLVQEKLFTGDVSHELRTPLTIIHGASDILLASKDLNKKNRDVAIRINNASADMIRLINAFLIMTRVERSSVKMELVSANQVLAEALERLRPRLIENNISVEFEENAVLEVRAASELLSIVVSNILRNASTYTKQGALIITINKDSLTVRDQGSGISQTIIDQIFSNRSQLEISKVEGNGMGLAIVKRICDISGWILSISSSSNGSIFTIHFP